LVLDQNLCENYQNFWWTCHRKNGPGKNNPAKPILDEKIVWPDHFWLTKNGPAGPFLATKSGPGWLKMVQCQELSNNVST